MTYSQYSYRTINRLFAFWLCLIAVQATAQNFKNFPTYIEESQTLEPGIYKVTGTCYVKEEAILTINSEATLIFKKNATIRVDGGLHIQGQKHSLVNFFSEDPYQPGNGFVISGVNSNKDVLVDFARFKYIKKPFSFEFRWSRKNVSITHSVIKNSNYEGASIEIKELDNLLTEKKVSFNISDNTFSNNSSSILFSNITTDLLTINFNRNVVTRNTYTGRTRNGIFTSPLYLTYNLYESNAKPSLSTNSIFDNYFCLYHEETFSIGRTNLSVIGSASKLDLGGNYFGKPSNREIEETVEYISANYRAPFLATENVLLLPSDNINGHFYEVLVNKQPLNENISFGVYQDIIKTITIRLNKPAIEGVDFGLYYHFVDADTIRSVSLNYKKEWSDINRVLEISISDKIKKFGSEGYLELSGLYDGNGIDVPTLTIGKTALTNTDLINYIPANIQDETEDENIVVTSPTKNVEFNAALLNDSFVHRKKDYWEVGIFTGNSIYFGDLNSTVVSANIKSMRPSGGIRFSYQLNEKLKLGLITNSMIIAGSDNAVGPNDNNPRGTGFSRNFSFRTTIVDLGINFEYNLTKYTLRNSYIPYVFGGVNAYYFKPMARINGEGEWYDLRSIGTEGQTLNGAQNQYAKVLVGIPCGIGIKRHFTERFIISLSYAYNKIFTDYLDDVSVGQYPESEALKAVNPDLGDKAVQLSNPGNLTGQRSYSAKHDGYAYWGLTFSFKL